MDQGVYDLAIIGGGINGCGIARDAVGRGASVCLLEQNDLGSATSASSTKLIHGGLRYLEYYEFRLVREALMEREALWALAPHIIWPLRFVLPHHKGLRPAWLLRLGLFLYDHLGGRKLLPPTRVLDLSEDPVGAPLKPGYNKAFEYSDCWVEDSRLVLLNAQDAAARGASIRPRTRCISAVRAGKLWDITLEDTLSSRRANLQARALVNAAGPWVAEVLGGVVRTNQPAKVRMVQGSHIVVPKLYDHDRCYIFQNADGRIIFAIPYEGDFTLIGTTDRDYQGAPGAATASPEEISYLCAAASEYFKTPITETQVVWTYSGVRPLYDDGSSDAKSVTRDYVLTLEAEGNGPPLLNVFGGKITTYRRLAEAALEKLSAHLPMLATKTGWTRDATLPGGDFPAGTAGLLVEDLRRAYPFLAPRHAARLIRQYGTRARQILGDAKSLADLGQHFGADLYQREVAYQQTEEWVTSAEDIVWRRSKLGLRLSREEIAELDRFLKSDVRSPSIASS